MVKITHIQGFEILDSRGLPTVEATVVLEDGSVGIASVPSGASKGSKEAIELRDLDSHRYCGKGVLTAIHHIHTVLSPLLCGRDALEQLALDCAMLEIDGTPDKSRLGANAVLAVSLAIAKAAAISQHQDLYVYLSELSQDSPILLPVPLCNILNGGRHANNNLDIQEFMILPLGAPSFQEALRCVAEIFQTLKKLLEQRGLSTLVGDEGGFAPNLRTHTEAIELILEAIRLAGYKAGLEVFMGLDAASSEFYRKGYYYFEGKPMDSDTWQAHLSDWVSQYPIISIEDGLSESDETGWGKFTQKLGSRLQLVGDDLFATHTQLLSAGIAAHRANAILIKPNQVGTLSETLAAIKMAKTARYATIISHRSGETEDTLIADLALGTRAGQIKTGSPCRTDRTAKLNRLLRIEKQLGYEAQYAGLTPFPCLSTPNIIRGCA